MIRMRWVIIKKIDYTIYIGKTINDLTIKELTTLNNRPAFICSCKCGTNNKIIDAYSVVTNRKTNCGICKLRSCIGRTIGRLTVVAINEDTKRCICNCSCGTKDFEVKYSDISREYIKSCGCIAKELKNKNEFIDDYVIGKTNKGDIFYFDKEDFDKISKYTWRLSHNGYMQTTITKRPMKKIIEMHSYIMNNDYKSGFVVDHINRNKCDNRKTNLRIVNRNMNGFNISKQINNTSGKTGVSFNKKNNNYMAYICCKNKRIYLGSFYNYDDAVKARAAAELKYFGELWNN